MEFSALTHNGLWLSILTYAYLSLSLSLQGRGRAYVIKKQGCDSVRSIGQNRNQTR